jgi:type VI secretion system protein ImpC
MNEMTGRDQGALGWMPLRLVAIAPLAGGNSDRPSGPIRIVNGAIDEAIAKVAPRLSLNVANPQGGGGATQVNLRFQSLADFRPEALLEQIPAAKALVEERGREPERAREIDALLTHWLDAVIHQPAYLELETAWRGLDYLASRGGAEAGEITPLILEALVAGAAEDYLPRFREQVFDPDYDGRADVPLAAVIADFNFDHQAVSMDRLTRLAGLANALQVGLVAGVGPSIFGLKNLAHLPSMPDLVTRTSGGPYAGWSAFQRENNARWVSLTVNRFLIRSAWGAGADTASTANGFAYRETVDPAHPEWLPWANAGWAVAASLARSYAEHGHCAAADGLSGTGGHHGLPTRELVQSATKKVRTPTEIVLADDKAWELCRAGFTPIVGMADGDIAYFPFLGNTYRPRVGSITLDQAFTYQMYAAQLSHVVLKLTGQMPATDAESACRWLEQGIFNYLSPFVGDKAGDNVKVTPVSTPDGAMLASIQVTPTFKIQDKPVQLEVQVPLG